MNKDLKKCIEYHGHKCMGLLMGYRAAKYALKLLKERKDIDEDIVAIVENSSCFVDAVSVITGCTFGKGNLIFKDLGKMALSVISRKTAKGIRVYLNHNKIKRDPRDIELMNKVLNGSATKEEKSEFEKRKNQREKEFMKMKDEDLFIVKDYDGEIPPKARIYPNVICSKCGESVMETRIKYIDLKPVCLECAR
jgi:formylmethanofuran dehydrogenase subunit E